MEGLVVYCIYNSNAAVSLCVTSYYMNLVGKIWCFDNFYTQYMEVLTIWAIVTIWAVYKMGGIDNMG